jgi:hypothetical protein
MRESTVLHSLVLPSCNQAIATIRSFTFEIVFHPRGKLIRLLKAAGQSRTQLLAQRICFKIAHHVDRGPPGDLIGGTE